MKKQVSEFFRRGLMALGFGPIILVIIYLILKHNGIVETLTVNEVCIGIFSISALAFIAGGMNAIYQIERLPLMAAISIHGVILYVTYLGTYLLNGWLKLGAAPILVFSAIFVVGYLTIWAIVYFVIKRNTKKLNEILKLKQQSAEEN